MGREQRRHLGGVVLRRDLHHVVAHEIDAGGSAEVAECVKARRANGIRGAGPGAEGRVDEVEVEGQERSSAGGALAGLLAVLFGCQPGQLRPGNQLDSELGRDVVPLSTEARASPHGARAPGR